MSVHRNHHRLAGVVPARALALGLGLSTPFGSAAATPTAGIIDGSRTYGRAGADTLTVGRRGFAAGGQGDDTIHAGGYLATTDGGRGNDVIRGGAGPQCLTGGDGNDTISGGGSADRSYGGGGRDRLYGGSGNDSGYGKRGNDRLYGSRGNDRR